MTVNRSGFKGVSRTPPWILIGHLSCSSISSTMIGALPCQGCHPMCIWAVCLYHRLFFKPPTSLAVLTYCFGENVVCGKRAKPTKIPGCPSDLRKILSLPLFTITLYCLLLYILFPAMYGAHALLFPFITGSTQFQVLHCQLLK